MEIHWLTTENPSELRIFFCKYSKSICVWMRCISRNSSNNSPRRTKLSWINRFDTCTFEIPRNQALRNLTISLFIHSFIWFVCMVAIHHRSVSFPSTTCISREPNQRHQHFCCVSLATFLKCSCHNINA